LGSLCLVDVAKNQKDRDCHQLHNAQSRIWRLPEVRQRPNASRHNHQKRERDVPIESPYARFEFLLVLLFRDACWLFVSEIVAKPRDAPGSDFCDDEPLARARQLDPPESRLLNPGPRVLETLLPSLERVEKHSKRPLVDRTR